MTTSSTIPLPPLPDGAPRRPDGRRYRRQFGVIVIVPDEEAQRALFDTFVAEVRKVRLVST